MSTSVDKLRRHGCRLLSTEDARVVKSIFEDLQDAPVLDISNVSTYYYESSTAGKDWKIGDFPNVAPAFHSCWVASSKAPEGLDGFVLAVAARDLIAEEQSSIFDLTHVEFEGGFGRDGEFMPTVSKPEGVRWQQDVLAIAQIGKGFYPLTLSTRYINDDGSVHLFDGRPRQVIRTFGTAGMDWATRKESTVVAGRLMEYPFLLASSFMHCRNVRLMKDEPPPRLSRRHERKHGFPLTARYTLLIDPMRKVLEREGEASGGGLPKALHICRGHFKTYTEEKPLFGKRTGTYWWPQTVRGAKKHGEVVKDYAVKAPRSAGGR